MASDVEPIYGTLPNKWHMGSVDLLVEDNEADVQTGPFGTMLHASAYQPEGTPVVAVKNIGNNRLIHDDIPRVSHETSCRLSRYQLQQGDILFGRKGAVERRAYVCAEEEGWLQGSDCIRLRLKGPNVDSRFVSLVLGSEAYRSWITQHAQGATMPSLNQEIIKRIPLPLPPPNEQSAIAHILGTLDDKIELNRRMNETLEAIARALFKSWFVDFDPVRAKAEGRDPGLPKHLAELFPDSFNNSKLGEIPKGWKVESLGQHIEAIRGVSYKGSGLADSGVPMHNLNSVYEGGGYKYEGLKYYTGEHREQHLAKPGDVIVANTEQGHDRLLIGYAAIVPRQFVHGIFSHHIYRLRPRRHSYLTSQFLTLLMNWPQMHDVVSGYANGTTVNMLPIDGVQTPDFVVPPETIIGYFDIFARHAQERAECLVQESSVLAALRDTLLPKLISGEIRIKDAERIAGVA